MPRTDHHRPARAEREDRSEPAPTRRAMLAGTAAALGAGGLASVATAPAPAARSRRVGTAAANSRVQLANVLATAEALATIVNTLGYERADALGLDAVTRRNVGTAAQQEKNHYELLIGPEVLGKPVTTQIHVPDEVFSSREALLSTLAAGDQVFINAYLLAITVLAREGTAMGSQFARRASEIMAVEAVHRALALQSLGRLGNDRVYARFGQREAVPGLPTTGTPGFYVIGDAVSVLESVGFGFGKAGSRPGRIYEYAEVAARTPEDRGVNTLAPS